MICFEKRTHMIDKLNSFICLDSQSGQINCLGEWKVDNLNPLTEELDALSGLPRSGEILINGKNLLRLDSSGAWALHRLQERLEKKGLKPQLINFSRERLNLLELIGKQLVDKHTIPITYIPNVLAKLGKRSLQMLSEVHDFLNFTGVITYEILSVIKHPSRIRFTDLTGIVEKAGLQALPIIALISFMVGIVLAHQIGIQLKSYGANMFIVDFLGYAALREFGPLITAIMVAGRTGSAFTAQLGIMKINQEIDALDTMGITPGELLILPRMAGLVIALPLLTVWADIFCILGGMSVSNHLLHVTWNEFLLRFQQQVPVRYFIIGFGKAPVFALIIASIGCFQGMMVRGSAESIGTKTTRSVVLAIFFIIVADALFSILLSHFNFK